MMNTWDSKNCLYLVLVSLLAFAQFLEATTANCHVPPAGPPRKYYWICYSYETGKKLTTSLLEYHIPLYGTERVEQETNTSFVGVCGDPKSYVFSETIHVSKQLCTSNFLVHLVMYQEDMYKQFNKILAHTRCYEEWKKEGQIFLNKMWKDGRFYEQFLSFDPLPFDHLMSLNSHQQVILVSQHKIMVEENISRVKYEIIRSFLNISLLVGLLLFSCCRYTYLSQGIKKFFIGKPLFSRPVQAS